MSANAQPKRPQAAVAAALAAALMVSAPVIGWASVEHVNLENDSLRLGTGSEVLVAEADADAESSKDGANGKREAKIEARVAKDRSRRNSRYASCYLSTILSLVFCVASIAAALLLISHLLSSLGLFLIPCSPFGSLSWSDLCRTDRR